MTIMLGKKTDLLSSPTGSKNRRNQHCNLVKATAEKNSLLKINITGWIKKPGTEVKPAEPVIAPAETKTPPDVKAPAAAQIPADNITPEEKKAQQEKQQAQQKKIKITKPRRQHGYDQFLGGVKAPEK